MLIAWDEEIIQASDPITKEYTLSITITLKQTNTTFLLTAVYGPVEDNEKHAFLQELQMTQPAEGMPWLCLRDFNLIYEARDKNNTNLNRRLMGQFRTALDHCQLMEIALQNRKYTWSNERNNPTLVHLDRVFCNIEWENLFPTSALQALSSSISDHCPLFLSQQGQQPRPATFKFEQFWTRVPGFMDVVKNAWEKPVHGISPMMILHNHLQNTAKDLKAWSQSLFGEARMQLHMVNEVILQLDTAQESRTLSEEESDLCCALKIRVLGLAAVERA